MKEKVRDIQHQREQTKLISIPLTDKNFGLTESEFNHLVLQLKSGQEQLFERIFLTHFETCMKYLMKQYKIRKELAYDVAMDTLVLFRKKLVHDKIGYGNLRYLYTKMASQLFIQGKQREDRLLEFDLRLQESDMPSEHLFDILERSWDKLHQEDRSLLKAYYYDKTPLIKIAESMGMTDSAIRKRKQRSLEALRTTFLNLLSIENG